MKTPTPSRILIIEDERPMRTVLKDCLEAEGYRVMVAADGADGLDRAIREKPDLILLDIMMPRLDGFALCQELRRLGQDTPILMLTAKSQVDDRVRGLDAGADDYLVKPFSSEELLARVRAILRRQDKSDESCALLKLGTLTVDFDQQTAQRNGDALHFTSKELAALQLMAQARGKAVSREDFLDKVWGYTSFPTTRTVDNHIASLRRKIETNPEKPRWIKTVHGVGYRLEARNGHEETEL